MDIILPDCKRLTSSGGAIDPSSEDRLSKLSDDVLCHILSFLTTKEAVAASILSKRWEYVWTSVPYVDITDQVWFGCESESHSLNKYNIFKDYVDRVLFYHGGTVIKKCNLSFWNGYSSSYIYGWVCGVIACSIQELKIESSRVKIHELPWRLFTCRTLVELEIKGRFFLTIPACVFFPCLKILYLEDVVYGDDASAQRLFSSCHVLEDLTISRDAWDGLQVMSISLPSLKRLSISSSDFFGSSSKVNTEIDCPGVEFFKLHGNSWNEFTINFSSSLVQAHIHGTCGSDILKGISQVKSLVLNNDVILSQKINDAEYSLPTFNKLVQVELFVGELVRWDFLPSFLESSPNLEVLIFPKGLVGSNFGGFNWSNPESVPQCLISHLKVIEIKNFVGIMIGEFNFVKYMLNFGEALEKIKIDCLAMAQICGMKKKFEKRLNYLDSCRRASSSCELLIYVIDIHIH